MTKNLLEFLFSKRILVSGGNEPTANQFEIIFTLSSTYNIKIIEGAEYADREMVTLASYMLGRMVPEPFYTGFPESVKKLSKDEFLYDQLLHYALTYGLGCFGTGSKHSVFEEKFERLAFDEEVTPLEFRIIKNEAALPLIFEMADEMMEATRPLSPVQYDVLLTLIREHGYKARSCASKNTAIRLLADTRDARYAKYINMAAVIDLLDEINYRDYKNENIKKLNLKNKDRKFITAILDIMFADGKYNVADCLEKKKVWCGLLHHIHYVPKCEAAKIFLSAVRGKTERSVYSDFEAALAEGDVRRATDVLRDYKGASALLRRLDHLISRCKNEEDIAYVLDRLDSPGIISLLQMIEKYSAPDASERTFMFTKHSLLKIHKETSEEVQKRGTYIGENTAEYIKMALIQMLGDTLRARLGRVYIDEDMKSIALPIHEACSMGGFGALPRGSRIHIDDMKKIRAFTYWEKVDDVDLAVIGLDELNVEHEFSWRTYARNKTEGICFSGDEVNGYDGGSEFFDIDTEAVLKEFPDMEYLIFTNNVYSGVPFCDCVCRAGYMVRDKLDTGEIFELKTVKSSFNVNCESTMAYIFAIDLKRSDLVWLNVADDSDSIVGATESVAFLRRYLTATDALNLGNIFAMMAKEIVESPEDADVVLSDKNVKVREGAMQIRSYDYEKIMSIIEAKM